MLGTLRDAGGRAYIVGGHVRDVLLGRTPDDAVDVATDLTPETVTGLFDEVIPTGLKHGTVMILADGVRVECTTFRREGEYGDARRPDSVAWTKSIKEDLARRDLTINAMAFDPVNGELVDPFGGLEDLRAGVLRAVGDPYDRFREDALRPLRVARFAAALDVDPVPRTRGALGASIERSGAVAMERVQQELCGLLLGARPSRGIELMRESGMLALWLPELQACVGVMQNRFHAYDVYRHSLETCDAAVPRRSVRWAALLHDIGKPVTRAEKDDGQATFYRHEIEGARMVAQRLDALRFPVADRDAVVRLVREHMFDYQAEWSDAAVRRWLRRVTPEMVDDLFALRRADVRGSGVPSRKAEGLEALRERIERLVAEGAIVRVRDLAVGGKDVLEICRVAPGPQVGHILNELLEHVIEHPEANERGVLLGRLRERAVDGA